MHLNFQKIMTGFVFQGHILLARFDPKPLEYSQEVLGWASEVSWIPASSWRCNISSVLLS